MAPQPDDLARVAAEVGKLFDPSVLVAPFNEVLAGLAYQASSAVDGLREYMAPPWAARPLRVGFIDSAQINAWANSDAAADYILIPVGVVEKIYGTMCGLLSTPRFLPDLGNSAKETGPSGALPDGFPVLPLLHKGFGDDPVRVYLPKDPARGELAMVLAHIALRFLVLHEVGHVIGGHLELRDRDGIGHCMAEVGEGPGTDADKPPRRVIECDADAFAAHRTSFINLHPSLEPMWSGLAIHRSVTGPETAFIAHAVAVSVLFRVLDAEGQPVQRPGRGEYPHPAVRSNLAVGRSFTCAMDAGLLARSDLTRTSELSMMHVEEVWASLCLPGRHFDVRSVAALEIGSLSEELQDEYERWQPELARVARVAPLWFGSWPVAAS